MSANKIRSISILIDGLKERAGDLGELDDKKRKILDQHSRALITSNSAIVSRKVFNLNQYIMLELEMLVHDILEFGEYSSDFSELTEKLFTRIERKLKNREQHEQHEKNLEASVDLNN